MDFIDLFFDVVVDLVNVMVIFLYGWFWFFNSVNVFFYMFFFVFFVSRFFCSLGCVLFLLDGGVRGKVIR